ncbi:hypothetical protein HCA61_04940 [Rhodococcus sp. HNM0563]|uniref:hypothetical protein n=1 Tax=Rhodococcus sp. HNM0563 TaxID=2716339 RepID=UPI00146AF711|nr:hypothetical protein [Rhodococcus sp. HNM0563]NLU61609.1 hypothetical protein [Rhodococcus sp. HNM0563]
MANGDPQRVEVRVPVESADEALFGSAFSGEGALRPVEPVPPICSRHGDPESDRVRVTIKSDRSQPDSSDSRLGSALAAAYTVQVAAVDWPVCARCVTARLRWQIAAAALFTALAVLFLGLVFALLQGAPRPYGFALLGVFGVSFIPLYVALRMIEHRRAGVGVTLAEDGSALVVRDAHPDFARAVSPRA